MCVLARVRVRAFVITYVCACSCACTSVCNYVCVCLLVYVYVRLREFVCELLCVRSYMSVLLMCKLCCIEDCKAMLKIRLNVIQCINRNMLVLSA